MGIKTMINGKQNCLLLWLVLFICFTAQIQAQSDTAAPAAGQAASDQLEIFIDQYVHENMPAAHVPGLVVVVVNEKGTLLAKGYGYADLEKKLPMTPQNLVRAGSVSKPVLATAVIQLVERGLLHLDIPVSDYIHDLELEDKWGPVSTVAQLLTHMSGYPDQIVLSHAPTEKEWQPLNKVLASDLPARTIAAGKVMAYSSWDYALLGYAMQKVSGLPYEEVVEKNLFAPLGMQTTTFAQPLPRDFSDQLAKGYGYQAKDDRYQVVPHDFVRMSPGVALVTTGEDMGRYMQALLNSGRLNEKKILNPQTMPLVLKRQAAAHAYSRGRSYAFTELSLAGRQVINHDGNGIGFYNRMILSPEHGIGIFLCTNHRVFTKNMSLTRAARMLKDLSKQIVETTIPESEVVIPAVQPLPPAKNRLKRYTGHYQSAGVSGSDFFKIQALMDHVNVKSNPDNTLTIGSSRYVEVEPLVFQSKRSPHFFVIFVENEQGKVEFITFGGTGSYRKVNWYQSFSFSIGLIIAIILIFLSMLIIWPLTRQGHWLIWLVSLLNLGFLVGVSLIFTEMVDLLQFYKTIPWLIKCLFALPWISGVLSIGLLLFLVKLWREQNTSLWNRIHYTLTTLASFALFWVANFWNMILK